jgi:benzoylformate decarboxylase
MFGPDGQRLVQDADVVLICGTYVFPEVFPSLRSPFRSDAKIIHIDLDAFEIAKNHPITIGLLSDPKMTLSQLADAVSTMGTGEQQRAVTARTEQISQANRAALESASVADDAQQNGSPLRMSSFPMPRLSRSRHRSRAGADTSSTLRTVTRMSIDA